MSLRIVYTPPLIGAAFCCAASAGPVTEPTAAKRSYHLPRGDASTTLRQFATISGSPVLFMMDKVQGEQTNTIEGDFSPSDALKLMLAGTSLEIMQDLAVRGFVVGRRTSSVQREVAERDMNLQPKTKTVNNHTTHLVALILALFGVGSNSLNAQVTAPAIGAQTTSTAPIPGDQVIHLQQFVVTTSAERIDENIQTVPIAITSIPVQDMQEDNITTTKDLQILVPSMTVFGAETTRDAMLVDIRGQGNTAGGPGVVTYFNDVPITFTGGFGSGAVDAPGLFFDLQNIQVLKGPQGTNFGQNSVGGAILLNSARPTNELSGQIQATYGNYDDREVNGVFNFPIVNDVLLVRIALSGQWRDGFTHLLGEPDHPNGVDADNENWQSVRATVLYRPNKRFSNETVLTYSRDTSNGSPLILTALNPSSVTLEIFPSLLTYFHQQEVSGIRVAEPEKVDLDTYSRFSALSNVTDLILTDEVTFKNIFGFVQADNYAESSFDDSPLGVFDAGGNGPYQQYSDEVQLIGKAFDHKLNWIVGDSYLEAPKSADWTYINEIIFGGPSTSIQKTENRQEAVYAWGTYDLSSLVNGLTFRAGFRYSWYNTYTISGPPTGPLSPTRGVAETAPTWTVGLDYQVSKEAMVYLASRRGFRTGGANGYNSTVGIFEPNYGPETVTDVEVGIKSDCKIGSVPIRFNAAAYDQDYNNVQVNNQTILGNGIPVNVTANAAKARITGAEAEVRAQLSENFSLGASYDCLDFQYLSFGPGVVGPIALNEQRFISRPPAKYGVDGRYRVPLGPKVGELLMHADWHWQAQDGDYSEPFGIIPAYGLLNVGLDWDNLFGKPIDLSFFCSNALNKDYAVYTGTVYNSAIGIAFSRFGDPRMYGARLSYKF